MTLETSLTPDYKKLNNKFTETVAIQLHQFDRIDDIDIFKTDYSQILKIQEDAIDRYKNDCVFNMKINSIVANLLKDTQTEHEDRLSKLTEKFGGMFRIVKAF